MFKINTCAESHSAGAVNIHEISTRRYRPSGSLLHSQETVDERMAYEAKEVLKYSYNLSVDYMFGLMAH